MNWIQRAISTPEVYTVDDFLAPQHGKQYRDVQFKRWGNQELGINCRISLWVFKGEDKVSVAVDATGGTYQEAFSRAINKLRNVGVPL